MFQIVWLYGKNMFQIVVTIKNNVNQFTIKKKIYKEKIYNNCRLFFKHWKKNPLNTDHQKC